MGADWNQAPETAAKTGGQDGPLAIRSLALEDVPAALWAGYVDLHPAATPYHRLAWLQAIEKAYGHKGRVLIARYGNDTVAGVLPLCHVKTPFGRGQLVSLPFCDLGGPIADTPALAQQLLDAAKAEVKALGAGSLALRLAGEPVAEPESTPVDSPAPAPKVSMLCQLPENAELLFKSYKPKLRSQIRKAEKNGLSAEVTSSDQAVAAFYPVFAANMQRLGSPVHSLTWFQCLQAAYGENMIIALVRQDDIVVGAGIVLLNGSRAAIPWASTLAEYNHLAPNMLLYWSLLSYVCDRGCRLFDFGRSTLGEGTYRFKKQWGARPHELKWVSFSADGAESPQAGPTSARVMALRQWIERLWQRLPLALANQLGPRIRKYITL